MTDTALEFERRARLSVIRQNLLTPVRAIVGYQEIIVEEAERLELPEFTPIFEKVLGAARALSGLVDQVARPDAELVAKPDGLVGLQARLRHDLRTPLNAIIGYSEMVLEDLDASAKSGVLAADIEKLLSEARRLLDRLDAIVDLTNVQSPAVIETTGDTNPDSEAALVARLVRTLRPDQALAKRQETGRILVVDDNESNRDLLRRRLVHEGHHVVMAESGSSALAIVEQEAFDLVLLDLLMPGMNGIEVLERLKSDPRWYEIPVIMISGLSETDAVIRCIEAGAEDYLQKPFNIVLLRARINACLERKRWRAREREYLLRLQAEKDRSERLLRNILPDPVVLRLNAGETIIADRFESATILFADIVGFTPAAALMPAASVVAKLDEVFSEFDSLAAHLGIEKIKTIGDAYMAAAGLPEARSDHAEVIVEFALGMLDALERINGGREGGLHIRIGIHTGPVVAGIIGRHKFIYDVWGDTVNVASRLESQGIPDRIQVSEETRAAIAHRYQFEAQGAISLKGKGETLAYLLVPPAKARLS